MFSVRCTRKLIDKLQVPAVDSPPQPTNRMGDWYGNVLFKGHHRLIIFVSEQSLLSVIIHSRERKQLLPNFRSRLSATSFSFQMFQSELVSMELAEMREVSIARTSNPSVLGTMNDLILNPKTYIQMHEDFARWVLNFGCLNFPADRRIIVTLINWLPNCYLTNKCNGAPANPRST